MPHAPQCSENPALLVYGCTGAQIDARGARGQAVIGVDDKLGAKEIAAVSHNLEADGSADCLCRGIVIASNANPAFHISTSQSLGRHHHQTSSDCRTCLQFHVFAPLGIRQRRRGPRFRMDAEMVRDYALKVSGLLNHKLGGPSVKPYQPDGVWEAVAMPESNTKRYERDKGDSLYRRSLYTFWKRAAPPALMDVFNAPSRETCSVRRERTNTPLQALATLNDIQFIEAARILAQGLLRQHRGDDTKLVAELGRRVLLRPLRDAERTVVIATLKDLRTHYAVHPDEAAQLLGYGEAPPEPGQTAADVAALTLVANQLLNLDEALNK